MGMFGSGIKLSRRINYKDEIEAAKRKCTLIEPENDVRSKYCNRYSFRWERPPQKDHENDNYLTITTIQLPTNIQSFNTGSSLKKWSCKKPRLKSHKKLMHLDKLPSMCDLRISSENLPFYDNHLQGSEENNANNEMKDATNEFIEHEDSIDEDIKRLCNLINNSGIDEDESERKVRTWRENNRKSARGRRGLTKKMTMTLSKPESPETEQVIRVEVVSNIILDIDSSEHASSCQNINGEIDDEDADLRQINLNKALILQCQKIELSNRSTLLI